MLSALSLWCSYNFFSRSPPCTSQSATRRSERQRAVPSYLLKDFVERKEFELGHGMLVRMNKPSEKVISQKEQAISPFFARRFGGGNACGVTHGLELPLPSQSHSFPENQDVSVRKRLKRASLSGGYSCLFSEFCSAATQQDSWASP